MMTLAWTRRAGSYARFFEAQYYTHIVNQKDKYYLLISNSLHRRTHKYGTTCSRRELRSRRSTWTWSYNSSELTSTI
jgi:hypothetical protein